MTKARRKRYSATLESLDLRICFSADASLLFIDSAHTNPFAGQISAANGHLAAILQSSVAAAAAPGKILMADKLAASPECRPFLGDAQRRSQPAFARPVDISASVGGLVGGGSYAAPTVATAASASPNPVSVTTTTFSVLGAVEGGEYHLSYTWATTGNRLRRR